MAVAHGVVTPRGIVLTVHGTALTARGTGAVRGIEAARGVVMVPGIVLTARGMAVVVVHGTGAVHGIEVARGAVMRRGIALMAHGTVLTARGTTVADVAVASAHSTGRNAPSPPGFVPWWGSDWSRNSVANSAASETIIERSLSLIALCIRLRYSGAPGGIRTPYP